MVEEANMLDRLIDSLRDKGLEYLESSEWCNVTLRLKG